MLCKYGKFSSFLEKSVLLRQPSKTDLWDLVGPTVTRQVQDPLAVLHLKNQLFITKIGV